MSHRLDALQGVPRFIATSRNDSWKIQEYDVKSEATKSDTWLQGPEHECVLPWA